MSTNISSALPEDTYIEQRFHDICQESKQGKRLWSDWDYQKDKYIQRLKTTIYEFMNYSRHDESHSINILQNIERILGGERVDKLGQGDLWVLLNVVYAHDIGMTTEYEDLEALWKDSDFLEFVEQCKEGRDPYAAQAAENYNLLDVFIKKNKNIGSNEKLDFKWDDRESWPLEFRKQITYLMAEYIRNQHGKRSGDFFHKNDHFGDSAALERLYGLIGEIVSLHTANISKVLELPVACSDLAVGEIHPRLIAVLLRVGDALDLDNNRFDNFSLKHFGSLPPISVAHYRKHKAITHFLIRPDIIEVTAESNDFDVCKIAKYWLDSLENEVVFLITHWKELVPSELEGCLMGLPKLIVKHQGSCFMKERSRNFELNRDKLLNLFIGNNLYNSRLEFIREYLQNAMDANRFQLWYELDLDIKKAFYQKNPLQSRQSLKPIDLKKEAYDNFPVIVDVRECIDSSGNQIYDKFVLEISDRGIGIDEEGINVLAHIGQGWRERENYTKEIRNMRQWFRPTGGFGIGIQSAFMMTDRIVIRSKSAYSDAFRITLSQNNTQENIMVEYDRTLINQGTTVYFEIKFDELNDDKIIAFYDGMKGLDFFNYSERLIIAYKIILKYVKEKFVNSLMPVIVKLNGKTRRDSTVQSGFFFIKEKTPTYMSCLGLLDESERHPNEQEKFILEKVTTFLDANSIDPHKIFINLELVQRVMRLWDDATESFYYIKLTSQEETLYCSNYKNVVVTPLKQVKWDESPYITDFVVDIMGLKVEDCLLVSRNKFITGKLQEILHTDIFTSMFFHIISKFIAEGTIVKRELGFDMLLYTNNMKYATGNTHMNILDDWEQGSLFVWEYSKGKRKWEKCDQSYAMLALYIDDEKRLIAIPEDREKINFQADNLAEEELQELYSKVFILDDKKTIAFINRYHEDKSDIIIELVPPISNSVHAGRIITIDNEALKRLHEIINRKKEMRYQRLRENHTLSIPQKGTFGRTFMIVSYYEEWMKPLLVSKIPFTACKEDEIYLISPYSNSVSGQIERRANMADGLQEQEFVQMVMDDPEFPRVCDWVYRYQKSTDRYNLKEIIAAYKRYLHDEFKKFIEQ